MRNRGAVYRNEKLKQTIPFGFWLKVLKVATGTVWSLTSNGDLVPAMIREMVVIIRCANGRDRDLITLRG